MKTILFLFFQISLFVSASSQSKWFPNGAKWTYEVAAWTAWGVTQLEVMDEDTLIGSVMFKKLLATSVVEVYPTGIDTFTEFIYVREVNNKVYSFDEFGGEFLYDFNAVTGDTLHEMRLGGYSPPYFIVDSAGIIDLDGVMLPFQDIKFDDVFNPGEFTEMRVIERIGSVSSFFLHSRFVIQPFDFPYYYPKCYQDPEVGLIRLEWGQAECGFFETGPTSTSIRTEVNSSIAPNPANNFVVFKNDDLSINQVRLVDMNGKTLITQQRIAAEDLHFDLTPLSSGIYFILGGNSKGNIHYRSKIVKVK